jgi:hypothetical protein
MGKAQISIFIIAGIALLLTLSAGTYFYITTKEKTGTGVQQAISFTLEPETIKQYVESCLRSVSEEIVFEISEKGGTFRQVPYRAYYGKYYPYICTQSNNVCVNRFVTRNSMETELNEKISQSIKKCMDFSEFRKKGYDMLEGQSSVSTTIGKNTVDILLNSPVKITNQGVDINIDKFESSLQAPLGILLDTVAEASYEEMLNSFFDEDLFMKQHLGISIEKHKPYPDTVYKLSIYDKDSLRFMEFNFAVQGIGTADYLGDFTQKQITGFCSKDGLVYVNVDRNICEQSKGSYSTTILPFVQMKSDTELCDGKPCADCADRKHGQSWCVYDGIAGNGFDAPGSRHYKQSCINGRIYTTECRDYREELCAEDLSIGKAVCRANRWQDCSEQTSKQSCEDRNIRDCYWSDWLYKAKPFRQPDVPDFSKRKCHPYTPPGFKHWLWIGDQACDMANEQYDCDGASCPMSWVDSTAIYCYMQGDCGSYFNVLKKMVIGGFYNTDDEPRNYVYSIPLAMSRIYAVPLKTDTFDHASFAGFKPLLTADKMKSNEKAYEARSDEFEPKMPSMSEIMSGNVKVEIDIDTLHSAYCDLWGAPADSSGCELCNSDPLKPCSEYKCRSIGAGCEYKEVDGKGYCGNVPVEKPTIKLEYAALLKKNVSVLDLIRTQKISKEELEKYIEKKLDVEKDVFRLEYGYSITEEIDPYSNLVFLFSSEKPIQCRTDIVNGNEFSAKKQTPLGYSETFPIFINAIDLNKEIPLPSSVDIKSPLQMVRMMDIGKSLDESRKIFAEQSIELSRTNPELLAYMDNLSRKAGNYTGYNVTSMEELMNKIDDTYKTQTEPAMKSYQQSAQEIMIPRELGNSYNFVTCKPGSGFAGDEFFVKYKLKEDREAPRISSVKPETETKIAGNIIDMEIEINEPAECRYSLNNDAQFDEMPEKIGCPMTSIESNFGVLSCDPEQIRLDNEKTDVFIKCKDQPSKYGTLFLNLKKGNKLGMNIPGMESQPDLGINISSSLSSGLSFNGNTISGESRIFSEKLFGFTADKDTVWLNISFNNDVECRNSLNPKDMFENIPESESFNCNANGKTFNCLKELNVLGNVTYYIYCRTKAESQNINSESYHLIYYR